MQSVSVFGKISTLGELLGLQRWCSAGLRLNLDVGWPQLARGVVRGGVSSYKEPPRDDRGRVYLLSLRENRWEGSVLPVAGDLQ